MSNDSEYIRVHILITQEQHQFYKMLSDAKSTSISEIIRDILQKYKHGLEEKLSIKRAQNEQMK